MMVRLIHKMSQSNEKTLSSLNSKMVRLIHEALRVYLEKLESQFQDGSINTTVIKALDGIHKSLNSRMVRLIRN